MGKASDQNSRCYIVLTRVPVPGAARDFSPRDNFQCSLSYGVHTAPVRNRMHQHLFQGSLNLRVLMSVFCFFVLLFLKYIYFFFQTKIKNNIIYQATLQECD